MGERVWQVPQHQFVAAWSGSQTLDEAAARDKALAGGPAPRWAGLARATALPKEGVELKSLPPKVAAGA